MSREIAKNVRLYKREEWGARSPRGTTHQGDPTEAFLHYTGPGDDATRVDHLSEQIARMKSMQNYHMDHNGWSDIGYHRVVFQKYGNLHVVRVFNGREAHTVPAAQLGHNTGTFAIQVYSDGGDEIKPATKRAIAALIKMFPSIKTLGGHKDVTGTDCPGSSFYRQIPEIAAAAGVRTYKPKEHYT